jgi:hypothetical protein
MGGGGKERKMNRESATANQGRVGAKRLKQILLQIESTIKIFYHKISLINVAPVIHAFQILGNTPHSSRC